MAAPPPFNIPVPLQATLQQVQQALANVQQQANQLRQQHPALAKLAGITFIVGGSVIVIPAVEAALLLLAGFGPLGPVAGAHRGRPR